MKRFRHLSYRTKVMLLMVGMVIASNVITSTILYRQCRDLLYTEIRSKVLSIATTASALMEGDLVDLHEEILTKQEKNRAKQAASLTAYRRLEQILRRVRDVNRREDTYLKFIYTMRQTTSPEDVVFVVDPEENPKDKSLVGEPYEQMAGEPIRVGDTRVDDEFTEDKYGTFLSSYAPLKGASGRAVGLIGVDVEADRVLSRLQHVLVFAVSAMVIGVALATAGALSISRRATEPLRVLRDAVRAIGKGKLDTEVQLNRGDEFGEVGEAVNQMTEGLRQREMLKTSFARYVSAQVMEKILEEGAPPTIGKPDDREVTVLFADIRGFTKISESMSPDKVQRLLNTYFSAMIEVIFRHHGTLDKFIGDGLMAIFGAPLEDNDHAMHAVAAALDMNGALKTINAQLVKDGYQPIRIGIGINSGEAVIGNIGSDDRMEYTAIGETVNLASRLESATKEHHVDILMSKWTYQELANLVECENVGKIPIRGHEDIDAYVPRRMLTPTAA